MKEAKSANSFALSFHIVKAPASGNNKTVFPFNDPHLLRLRLFKLPEANQLNFGKYAAASIAVFSLSTIAICFSGNC